MSKYSEVIGSFIRRGNYPLEADYIFANEAELKEFYLDPLLAAILHEGLFKIVKDDGNGVLALYWITKTGDNLEFTKLISEDTSSLLTEISNSLSSLLKEVSNNSELISDLKEDVSEIVGTEEPLTYGNLAKVNEALEGLISGDYIKIITDNEDDVIALKTITTVDGVLISGKLILSPDSANLLEKKAGGLYYNLTSSYENGILTIKANGNIISLHNIGITNLVESAVYNSELESVVIKFKLLNGSYLEIYIPLSGLIREWEVDNTSPSKVVELTREEVYAGGADKLSADIRLSDNQYNIIERDLNRLLVKGTSDNIRHEDVLLSVVLNKMCETFSSMDSEIQALRDKVVYLEANSSAGALESVKGEGWEDQVIVDNEGNTYANTLVDLKKYIDAQDSYYRNEALVYTDDELTWYEG